MNNKDLIAQYVDTGLKLSEHQVVQLPGWAKKTYIRKRLIAIERGGKRLEHYEFRMFDDEGKWDYFIRNEKNNGIISGRFLDETPDYIKLKIINLYIDKEEAIGGWVGDLFDIAPLELKRKWLEVQISHGRNIELEYLEYMDDELLVKFVNKEIEIKLKFNVMTNINGQVYGKLPYALKTKVIDAYVNAGNIGINNWNLWYKTPIELQKRFVIGQVGTGYNIDPEFYDELDNEVKLEYLEHLIVHLKKLRGNNWDTYLSDKRRDDYNRLKNEQ